MNLNKNAKLKLLSQNLQAFTLISRLGTVHAAARQLGLAQTAVTQRLKILEADLNATLFTRSRRGMTLTDSGHALLKYCREAQDLEGEVLAKISGDIDQSSYRITLEGPSSILRARVIPATATVLKEYPQVAVEFRISDDSPGALSLKRGLTDVAIIPRGEVVSEFDSRLIRPERYVMVVSPDWAKRNIADIVENERIIDFDASDTMSFQWLEKFDLRKNARDDRHFVNNTDALASMVMQGLGYSVLATEFADPYLDRGELVQVARGKYLDFELALAWYPRRHPTEYWQKLLKAIR